MGRYASKTPDKFPKYLGDSEIQEILKEAKKHKKRNYLILLTLYRTGLRSGELLKSYDSKDTYLRVKDVSFDEGHITIRDGKGGKDRVVPLEKDLGDILDFYVEGKHPEDPVFDISARTLRNQLKMYTDKKWVHPHTFRHSFAVHCLKSDMDLRTLQKILGHSDIGTTQMYLDITGEDVKDEFKKIKW